MQTSPASNELDDQGVMQPPEPPALPSPRVIYLLRHGQTTFNIEGRLPGQLEGVALTDAGRRQAYRAAVALSGVPLGLIVSSPLERALETARLLARGPGLEVRADDRLKDTDVGPWAGQKIAEVEKNDPRWKAFLEHPDEPPPGVESLAHVQERAVAVVEGLRRDAGAGTCIAVVAHADIVKLILAHYMRMHIQAVRYVSVGNAAISALAFQGEQPPHVLGVNWTPLPDWLAPLPKSAPHDAAEQSQTGAIVGLETPFDPAPPSNVS
jgi:broad specificity phosphatase PhoE